VLLLCRTPHVSGSPWTVPPWNRLQLLATACNRWQPPAATGNRLQLLATACNRWQPPATAGNRLQPARWIMFSSHVLVA
jgi:hypothetical protein